MKAKKSMFVWDDDGTIHVIPWPCTDPYYTSLIYPYSSGACCNYFLQLNNHDLKIFLFFEAIRISSEFDIDMDDIIKEFMKIDEFKEFYLEQYEKLPWVKEIIPNDE